MFTVNRGGGGGGQRVNVFTEVKLQFQFSNFDLGQFFGQRQFWKIFWAIFWAFLGNFLNIFLDNF